MVAFSLSSVQLNLNVMQKLTYPFVVLSMLIGYYVHAQTWQYSAPNTYFSGGYVGIGTGATTTYAPLHINNGGYAAILMGDNNSSGFVLTKEITNGGSFNIWSAPFGTEGSINRFKIDNQGNIGIGLGTTAPAAQFHISSPNSYVSMLLGPNTSDGFLMTREGSGSTSSFNIWSGPLGSGPIRFKITNAGNILIGKYSVTNADYILDVNGNVRANKIVVNTTGADYVFEKRYPLLSLDSLRKYIVENHHLPGIEPASQMQKEGVDVGNNQTMLLKKMEEMTLYILQQQKEIQELKARLERLER
jgi:hypothetical protein